MIRKVGVGLLLVWAIISSTVIGLDLALDDRITVPAQSTHFKQEVVAEPIEQAESPAQAVEKSALDEPSDQERDEPSQEDSFLARFQQLTTQSVIDDKEQPSPSDWIPMDNIRVYDNQVIIKIDNPQWAVFTDTNSMDPLIDEHSNAIEIVPTSADQLQVGDIVAYESKYATGTITHRIVAIGEDEDGWYATLKGDNNRRNDPGKVRFSQIKRVIVGILY